MTTTEAYQGFELGPIRPPSEARSLLLRVSRNCPWNKCKFCGLYKGEKFSVRPVEHIKQGFCIGKCSEKYAHASVVVSCCPFSL